MIKIDRLGGAPISFEAFAKKHGLVMKVGERSKAFWPERKMERYHAEFENAETLDGSVLSSAYGNGNTPEEAIADYAKNLEGKLLVIGAYQAERREIQCPNEWEKEN